MTAANPPDREHPFVGYLNSLRTQSEGGNPGYVEEIRRPSIARIRREHPWFPKVEDLHVATLLDGLVDVITAGDPGFDILILTGDAGDGKTAVCARLASHLGHDGDLKPSEDVGPGGRWRILKDASELLESELVTQFEEAIADRRRGLVLAINEGRLRRLVLRPNGAKDETRERFNGLWDRIIEPALRSVLDQDAAEALDAAMRSERIAVINFRHRMHVRTVTPGLLEVWSAPSLWEDSPRCGECSARAQCPILANVRDLRRHDVQERVADVLTAAHYAGQRLPFRRLQAVLALAVTGGLQCDDVLDGGPLHGPGRRLDRLQHRYYDVLFPHERRRVVVVRQEAVTRVLAATDPGLHSDDELDASINALAAASDERAGDAVLDGDLLGALEADALTHVRSMLDPTAANRSTEPAEALADLTRALRRWKRLRGSAPAAQPTWRRALTLLERYALVREGGELQRRIVGSLNTLQRLSATNESHITGRQVDPMGFRTPDRLDLEFDLGTDFAVSLRCGPHLPDCVSAWLESTASEIELEAWPVNGAKGETERLRIDLALLSALLSAADGYTLVYALGAYRRDLSRFFSRLAARAHEAGHAARVSLRVDGKTYCVDIDRTTNLARLTFEGRA